ncbi:MAG: MarR family winged helix-turn-helix transcriptional regulator [Methylocella sp.]
MTNKMTAIAPSRVHEKLVPDDSGETGSSADDWRLRGLQERPGFLIRRLHQIHVALFTEECASENITPVQYSVLTALEQMGPSEQVALSRAVGLDRTNIADVIARLERRKFVKRRVAPKDRRTKIAALTEAGRRLLAQVEAGAARAHERTIEALPADQRERFVDQMRQLVRANNELSRSPISRIK